MMRLPNVRCASVGRCSIVVLCLVIGRSGPGVAQAAAAPFARSPALLDSLVALERQSWEAWQKRNGGFFQHFLADDHVEVGVSGRSTKSTVVAAVGSPACAVKSYAIDQFELTIFDAGTALLTYHAAQDTRCGNTAVPSPAWASSLYIRRAGRWENALYQQTPITH